MKSHTRLLLVFLLLATPFAAAAAQPNPGEDHAEDIAAIEALLREYRATQDAGDLIAQSRLMVPERIWINQAGQRRTDNAENMRRQQAEADEQQRRLPGLKTRTEDRDVLIRLFGDAQVAVVSFFRTATRSYPPGTPEALQQEFPDGKETGTLVLEKQPEGWRIVHTHWSGVGH